MCQIPGAGHPPSAFEDDTIPLVAAQACSKISIIQLQIAKHGSLGQESHNNEGR
jgi:hypothetical protein